MSEIKLPKPIKKLAVAAVSVFCCWFCVRYALRPTAPLILAFLSAALLEPAVKLLTDRLRFRRRAAASVASLVFLAALSAILGFFLRFGAVQADRLTKTIPDILARLPEITEAAEARLERLLKNTPPEAKRLAYSAIDKMGDRITSLPAELSAKLMERFSETANSAVSTVLFSVTYAIGVFFVSVAYPEICAFFSRQVPDSIKARTVGLKRDLAATVGKWLLAQLILFAVTFAQLLAALLALRVRGAVAISIVTAIVDALPILGVGAVLVPWALLSILFGRFGRAAALFGAWLIIMLVRRILEPRLIGAKTGVNPAAALLAIYAGFKLCGVGGMILAPIVLLVINLLNEKGYLKIWKKAEDKT